MNGNMAYGLGFTVGLMCVAAACLLLKKRHQSKGEECKYDERQEAARGRAFKMGFFALMGYEIVVGVGTLVMETEWFVDSFAHCIVGIGFATTVFACKCIMEDAYYALNRNRKATLIVLAAIGVMNGLLSIRILCNERDRLIVDGKVTYTVGNLVVTVMFLALAVATLIKSRQENREVEE